MARLPTPGSDTGTWGDVLNDFLQQAHATDGALKADSVGTTQLQDDSVTADQIAAGAVTKADVGLGNVDNTSDANKPVSAATQTALDAKADSADVGAKVLLISDVGSLPPGTPAGVVVVVES